MLKKIYYLYTLISQIILTIALQLLLLHHVYGIDFVILLPNFINFIMHLGIVLLVGWHNMSALYVLCLQLISFTT